MNNKIWMFLAVILTGGICQAYRILVIVPIPSRSHAILGDAYVTTLLEAGHEVVYVTAMPKRLEAHPRLTEVDVSANAKYFPSNVLNLTNFLVNEADSPGVAFFLERATIYCEETMKHDDVQKLLTDGRKFDLVIAEWLFSEIYAGLPAVLDCPLIWLSSMEPHGMILSLVDESPNLAYNADFAVNCVAPFTFWERTQQLGVNILVNLYREYYVYFEETKIFNSLYEPIMKKLGKTLPSYSELRYNASLLLSNSHVSLGQAMRLPQSFISIGGYHVDPEVKPLPKDVKKIMDNAKHGVIYFSMGSILKSKDFPQQMKMELLTVLGSLKQTVLWKYEEDITDLPKNVHVLKWASQQSILAHRNCILFITHGGLLSLTESIHYAVPVIGIPVFADQFVNILRSVKKGFAIKVDLTYDLAKDLQVAIKEIIENSRYKEKVKELSYVYHHRTIHPRKEILHWVEHVVETKGAPVLRSPALQVRFYEKYFLDLALVILILLFLLRRSFIWIKSKYLGPSSKEIKKKISDKKKN